LNSRTWGLLRHSLGLAALVTAGSTLLGLGAAVWIVTRPARLGRLARKFYLTPFIIPGYIYALTWLSLLSRASVLAPGLERLFGQLPSPYGLTGAALILALAYAPLVTLVMLAALEASEPALIEQALLLVPARRVWYRVVLPLSWPGAWAAAGLVFALALVEYGVPALLEFNVYPMEIYAEFSQSGDPLHALQQALPVLVIAALLVGGSQWLLRRTPLSGRPQGAALLQRLPLPTLASGLAWLAALSLAVASLLPVLVLIIQTGRPAVVLEAASQARSDLLTTLLLAVSAAVGATLLAVSPARRLTASDALPFWLWAILLAPLAIPAPLVGIGLVDLGNYLPGRRAGLGLILLWAAHVGRFAPLALAALVVQFRRRDALLHELAQLFPVGRLRRFWQIDLPLLLGGIGTALAIVFVLSLGEIGATLLVIPPGLGTVALRLYNLLHYGAPASTAGLALGLLGLILVTGGVLAGKPQRGAE
jgi:iron(III) transport system permease protein